MRSHIRRRSFLSVAAVTVALFLLGSCIPPTQPGGRNSGAALQKAMNAFVSQAGGPPGMVVAIGRGSQFTLRTAGVANIVTKVKPAADDQMRLASVAKAFSGAAALSLVSHGKLQLSDTVGQLLPGMPAAWKHVTLSQLLGHTSGVPDSSKVPEFGEA